MAGHLQGNQDETLRQIAQKRKREAEPQGDVHELEEPLQKRLCPQSSTCALVLDLPQPSPTSAATGTHQKMNGLLQWCLVVHDNLVVMPQQQSAEVCNLKDILENIRNREETLDDSLELEEPAVLDPDLHPQLYPSAATTTDDKKIVQKRKMETESQCDVQGLKEPQTKRHPSSSVSIVTDNKTNEQVAVKTSEKPKPDQPNIRRRKQNAPFWSRCHLI
ncbi:uncharacterized protein LOC128518637 [Clarias gariepinus]|uniref:uncharacterized protein LOC128518637 n=1 Tax=Clarias gariepinus TaxID=13013 RepID=UPI00234D666A|nr:uncharacterized protein LOC128518637 [Clarias gariepinus]